MNQCPGYFEFENGCIDVDFGPDDRCDGFDFNRLKDFLLYAKKDNYQELHDIDLLKHEFEALILHGEIVNPQWQPNTHLYYLRERI